MTDRDGKINPQGGRRNELPADFLLHRKNISEFYKTDGRPDFTNLSMEDIHFHLKDLCIIARETAIFFCPESFRKCEERFIKSFIPVLEEKK